MKLAIYIVFKKTLLLRNIRKLLKKLNKLFIIKTFTT